MVNRSNLGKTVVPTWARRGVFLLITTIRLTHSTDTCGRNCFSLLFLPFFRLFRLLKKRQGEQVQQRQENHFPLCLHHIGCLSRNCRERKREKTSRDYNHHHHPQIEIGRKRQKTFIFQSPRDVFIWSSIGVVVRFIRRIRAFLPIRLHPPDVKTPLASSDARHGQPILDSRSPTFFSCR